MSDERPKVTSDDFKIDAKSRYTAAQSEINMRITTRATLNVGHVAIVGTLSGIYFAVFKVQDEPTSIIPYFPCIIALASTFFASLNKHNETVLGYLTLYNRTLEEIHIAQTVDPIAKGLPTWYGGAREAANNIWMNKGLEARRWANRALMCLSSISPVLVFLSNVDYTELVLSPPEELISAIKHSGLPLLLCMIVIIFNLGIFLNVGKFRDTLLYKYKWDKEKHELTGV